MGKCQQWLHVERSLGWARVPSGLVSAVGTCGEEPWAGLAAKWVSAMGTCGEEPGVGLAAKWVSVSNGYMWRRAWDGPGCRVGKCQQWLHVERSLGRVWMPSG